MPSGGLYATYHLLREPETTIDVFFYFFSFQWFLLVLSAIRFIPKEEYTLPKANRKFARMVGKRMFSFWNGSWNQGRHSFIFRGATRWAPASYKWGYNLYITYNPYKWPKINRYLVLFHPTYLLMEADGHQPCPVRNERSSQGDGRRLGWIAQMGCPVGWWVGFANSAPCRLDTYFPFGKAWKWQIVRLVKLWKCNFSEIETLGCTSMEVRIKG